MNGTVKNERENKMGTLPVSRLVITMSIPAAVSMLVGALYNIVESVFVARISEDALAAITLVFPVQMFMVSIGVGSGVGLSSLISRRLGERLKGEADRASSHGFIVALGNWVIFAVFGLFFARPFIELFTQNAYICDNAALYCKMVTIGSLFSFISIACERILQATGNMMFPMIFNISGAALNIILSPILILGLLGIPRLEILGAGLAALISQCFCMILALVLLFRFKHPVTIRFRGFRLRPGTIKDIYSVGLPTMVSMSINSAMITGMNAILIGYSEAAIAVFGLYYRINSFAFLPLFGMNQGALPVMGYNYGAKYKQRLTDTIKTTITIAVCIMIIGTAVFWIFTPQLLALFSATPEMIDIGIPALRIISIGFIFAAYNIAVQAFFQALNHGALSMFVSLLRQMVLALPLAWLFLRIAGIHYTWVAFPLAEIGAATLTAIFMYRIFRHEVKPMKEV